MYEQIICNKDYNHYGWGIYSEIAIEDAQTESVIIDLSHDTALY